MPGPGPGAGHHDAGEDDQHAEDDDRDPVEDVALLVALLALAQLHEQLAACRRALAPCGARPRSPSSSLGPLVRASRRSGSAAPGGGQRVRARPAAARSPDTPASRSTVARFDSSIGARPRRPRGHHDAGDLEPDGPRRLDREQRVVDRAEAGARGHDQRQAEVAREVAHEVAGRDRHEQPADALADEHVGAARPAARAAASSRAGSIVSPASSAAKCGESGGPKR